MDYYVNLTMYKQDCIQTDLTLCQGDYGQKLYLSGISDSRSAKIVFKKPDGKTVEYTSLIKSGDNYVHTFKPAELQAIGKVVADVKFYDSNSRESSQKFTFNVKADTINDSVKESKAYSDSIVAAQTEFNALIADMTTQIQNFIAQKIIYADTDLQTYVDSITSRANTAAQACEDILADKVGISNTPSDATAYSGKYTQRLLDTLQQLITANTQSIQTNASAIATTNKNLKLITYVNLSDIGLTTSSFVNSTDDVATVASKMADNSMFVYAFSSGRFGLPSSGYGVIEIIRNSLNRVTLRAINQANNTFYYGTYHSTSGFSGWYSVTGTLLS